MKSSIYKLFVIPFMCLIGNVQAGIICPDDVSYTCDWYALGIPSTPEAKATGNDIYLWKKFKDYEYLSNCNEGYIDRVWYIDRNENNQIDSDEPSCTQKITITGPDAPIQISWPQDMVLNCLDDETDFGSPDVISGPCDLLGVSYEDAVFGNSSTECYKILRTYKVCNYCYYDENDPSSGGIWTHTQVIKVVDEEAPIIDNCENRVISTQGDCKAEISITKSAFDQGDCPASELIWNVSVDVGLDGVIDYRYGPNESGPFKLTPKSNNEAVTITLPDRLDKGYVEMKWTVADGCGNHAGCVEKIHIKDLKPPTPYCYGLLFFTLDGKDGGTLTIPASVWKKEAIDNCGHEVRYSYSKDVNDTLKVVKCGQTGVQLDRIYATDISGNQEYCTVYSFIFDNGSCNFLYGPQGKVQSIDGEPLPEVMAVFSNGELHQESIVTEEGLFFFEDMPMMENLTASLVINDEAKAEYSLQDAKVLSNYLLGIDSLSASQILSADMNEDHVINFRDLSIITNQLIGKTKGHRAWRVIAEDDYSISSSTSIAYPDYDGNFDFTLIQKGKLARAEEISEETIEISVSEFNGKYIFHNAHRIPSEGFFISTNTTDIIDLKSSNLDEGGLMWEVSAKSLEEAIASMDVQVLDSQYKTYKIDYKEYNSTALDKASFVRDNDISIYPTVSKDYFRIMGTEIEDLEIFDVNGSKLAFDKEEGVESMIITPLNYHGLIIVKFQSGKETYVEKVIKL